jgi:hypothetical protein
MNDTAVLATDSNPAIASHKLQTGLLAIQHWLKMWRMKANGSKSTQITFTTRRETCPPVHINNVQLPQAEEVKYLGLHLDLPGATTSLPNGSNSAPRSPKCTGCSDASLGSLKQQTSRLQSYTKTHLDLWHATLGNGLHL